VFKKYQTRSKPPKNGKYPVTGNPYELEDRHAENHPEDCDCEWILMAEDAKRKNGKVVADKSEAYWMGTIGKSCMDSGMKKTKESMDRGMEKFNEIADKVQEQGNEADN
jgi:hypothetical protein